MRERQSRRGAPVTPSLRSRLLLTSSFGVTLVIDQVSKAVALARLEPGERVELVGTIVGLKLVANPGGAFSMLQDQGALLAAIVAVVIVVVAVWAVRSGEFPVELGLVLGGGAGNLADRVFRQPGFPHGRVIDFLDLSFWPTFNLADAAITIGVAILLIRGFASRKRE